MTVYCTLNFHYLVSELIQEIKEKFVSKLACCHSLLSQIVTDFIYYKIVHVVQNNE